MRWTHVKRKRPLASVAVDEEPPISMSSIVPLQQLRSSQLDVDTLLKELPRQLSHAQLARLLWCQDYWPIFLSTLGQYADVSEAMTAVFTRLRGRARAEVDRDTVLRLALRCF